MREAALRKAGRASFVFTVLGSLLLVAAPAWAAEEALPEYQVAETCGYCHDTQYREFAGSVHSQAAVDPVYLYEVGLANEQTDDAVGPFCLQCHAPIGHARRETAPPTGAVDGSALGGPARGGVTCDFCHTVAAVGPTFPGNADCVIEPGLVKRGPYDDSVSPGHDTVFSGLHTTSDFCGICHDVEHPTNGLRLEATYTEWKESPYAAEGVQCQNCHMVPIPGPVDAPRGSACLMTPDRDRVWLMDFQGANAVFGRSAQAEKLLRSAATLDLALDLPEVVETGTAVRTTVTVNNVGAGHYLPTGLTDLRLMWLEVSAVGEDGTSTEVGRVEYHTVFADESGGHDHVPVWFAASVHSDRRVPPRGSLEEIVEFPWPEGVEGDARVVASLRYRSFPQELADTVDLGVEVPTILMAQAEQAVTVAGGDGTTPWWVAAALAAVAVTAVLGLALTRRRGKKAPG